ncbi:MAG TPA: terminase small subunit [Dongiaceae bacterium]|nr:terminase small subunit [Dongiaceae bacterium]
MSQKAPRKRKPKTPEQRQRDTATQRARRVAERELRAQEPRFRTLRQEKFIEAYLLYGALAPAAREAGYGAHAPGNGQLRRLLRRPDVAALIEARQAEMRALSSVTMQRVIGELAKIAFADPRDLFTADGRPKPLHELDEAGTASIAATEVVARKTRGAATGAEAGDGDTDGGDGAGAVLQLHKIRCWDKVKALELLGRYLGLFKDRLDLQLTTDLVATIHAARLRAQAVAGQGVISPIPAASSQNPSRACGRAG